MATTILAGGMVVKDPDESEVYLMDWNTEHLVAGVTITSSTWIISGPDAVLTKDSESLPTTRTTQLRLIAGTVGVKYKVTNRIVTNESPTRTKDRSVYVLIEAR